MGHCTHQTPILYDGAAAHPLHDAAPPDTVDQISALPVSTSCAKATSIVCPVNGVRVVP